MEDLETINPFTLAPWEKRVQTITDETAAMQVDAGWAVRLAVSSSARNGVVGMGGVVELPASGSDNSKVETFFSTLGTRLEQNPYSGELAAMAHALSSLPKLRFRSIVLLTSNRAAAFTLGRPRQQSGQDHICHSYETIRALRRKRKHGDDPMAPRERGKRAPEAGQREGKDGHTTRRHPADADSEYAIDNSQHRTVQTRHHKCLPEKVGSHSKRVDAALPGKHTRQLYDRLAWREARVLAQLRTGMARLNAYLYRIKWQRQVSAHVGKRERQWSISSSGAEGGRQRTEMLRCTDTQRGSISFHLGGKSPADDKNWTPNMEAVQATIRFAMATGRLDAA